MKSSRNELTPYTGWVSEATDLYQALKYGRLYLPQAEADYGGKFMERIHPKKCWVSEAVAKAGLAREACRGVPNVYITS